jgi:hypothetical protein
LDRLTNLIKVKEDIKKMEKAHVAINMNGPNGSGSTLDVALAREEALHRFREINWATYTR